MSDKFMVPAVIIIIIATVIIITIFIPIARVKIIHSFPWFVSRGT